MYDGAKLQSGGVKKDGIAICVQGSMSEVERTWLNRQRDLTGHSARAFAVRLHHTARTQLPQSPCGFKTAVHPPTPGTHPCHGTSLFPSVSQCSIPLHTMSCPGLASEVGPRHPMDSTDPSNVHPSSQASSAGAGQPHLPMGHHETEVFSGATRRPLSRASSGFPTTSHPRLAKGDKPLAVTPSPDLSRAKRLELARCCFTQKMSSCLDVFFEFIWPRPHFGRGDSLLCPSNLGNLSS